MRLLVLLLLVLVVGTVTAKLSKTKLKLNASSKNELLSRKDKINQATKTIYPKIPGDDGDDDDEDIDDDVYRTDSTGCPVAFDGRCQCRMAMYLRNQVDKYVVNCTNTGFTNASMLEALPDNTEVLIFTGNFIPVLPINVFGTESDFDDLETIDMTNNGIKEIDGQSFHRVSNVKTLILNHNDLYIVDSKHHPRVFSNFESLETLHLTNTFDDNVDSNWYMVSLEIIFQSSMLTNLKKLHLEQNEIWSLRDPRTFCHLPGLQQLYLGSNRLTGIELDLLCLRKLTFLDLEYNSIRRLDDNATALLDDLTKVNPSFSVKLTGNPFFCDCQIEPLFHWLLTTNTNVHNHESYRCFQGQPAANVNKPIMQLKHMECAPPPAPPTSSSSVALTVLLFFACVLLGVVIYLQRHRLARRAKTLQPQLQTAIQNVKRARQYTNVERQEATAEMAV